MNTKIIKLYKTSFIILAIILLTTVEANALSKRQRQRAQERANARPYKHVCQVGTEPVGAPPPKGSQIWCRQPTPEGYWRQGQFAEWYQNGEKRVEGEYAQDKKHGIWKTYNRNGRKKSEIIYYDGKEVKKTLYDRKGQAMEDPKATRLERKQSLRANNSSQVRPRRSRSGNKDLPTSTQTTPKVKVVQQEYY